MRFASTYASGKLDVAFETETGKAYQAAERGFALKVHNLQASPRGVTVDGRAARFNWNARHKLLEISVPARKQQSGKVSITL